MKMTCWINKGLKGEKCFVEEFDNKYDLLSPIYGVDKVERCFYLGKEYDTGFDMHIYVLNKKELIHALEYLDILVSDSKSKKITGLWYDLNRELYDEVRKDFEDRLYNERLEEWLKYHDDSEDFPGVDMNALPLDDLCRLLKELIWVASQYETDGEK